MQTDQAQHIATTPAPGLDALAPQRVTAYSPPEMLHSYTGGILTRRTNPANGDTIILLKTEGVHLTRMLHSVARMLGRRSGSLKTYAIPLDSAQAEQIRNYLGDMDKHTFFFLQINGEMFIKTGEKLLGVRK